MIRKKNGAIEWLEFELLADQSGLVHGVFLRHGGISPGPFGSLNVGGGAGDTAENVLENRNRILRALNVEQYVAGFQVHSNTVAWVQEENQQVGECDALITDKTNLALMIKHADCQAAVFYDPIHRALANVHSGWRGNVKNIYRATVQKMRESFGTKPEDLLVGVSPSLGPNHAEFKNYKTEFPEEFWTFQVRPEYFDLWAIARYQLEQCGVLAHHIEIAGICTYANDVDYFSYRRDKVTGRNNATLAMLRK
jgi:polyphenol oxidase